jgi:hypothetical protein
MTISRTSFARRSAITAAIFAVVAAIGLPASVANASSPAPIPAAPASNPVATTTTVELEPDCTEVSAKARAYIVTHNLGICGITGSNGLKISPQVAVAIHCGYANITDSWVGGGYTSLEWSVTSTVGEMDYRDLYISWSGSNGNAGSDLDLSAMLAGSYTKNPPLEINSGFNAYATMNGTVTIWYGLTCYANNIHT